MSTLHNPQILTHYLDDAGKLQRLEPGMEVALSRTYPKWLILENRNQAEADVLAPRYVLIEESTQGDYVGYGSVGLANQRVIQDEFKEEDLIFLTADYSWSAVAVLIGPETQELLKRLDNYPSLSDEEVSKVEMEWADEAWDSWAKSDFVYALRKRFPEHEDLLDTLEPDALRELFEQARERVNRDWVSEYSGVTIDTEVVAKAVTDDDLEEARRKQGPEPDVEPGWRVFYSNNGPRIQVVDISWASDTWQDHQVVAYVLRELALSHPEAFREALEFQQGRRYEGWEAFNETWPYRIPLPKEPPEWLK